MQIGQARSGGLLLLGLIVLAWGLTSCSSCSRKAPSVSGDGEGARPNIIIMMADDMGWGDVGFNGNAVIKTPNLDAMAAAGLKLNRFYASAPVCSPTRGSVMTGRHGFRYGVLTANRGHLRAEEITLPELLREAGYTTGHFGKWHLGTLTTTMKDSRRGGSKVSARAFAPPWEHGFERCFSTEAAVPTYDPMLEPRAHESKGWWDPVEDEKDALPYGTHYWNEKGEVVTENLRGDDSRIIMDRAIPFIEEAARAKKPFFAVIWFHAPHTPVVAGPEHTGLYPGLDPFARHYYGCITALDDQVGRLRERLRQLGIADNTFVAFSSDNGPSKSAPGTAKPFSGHKNTLREGGVRVPAAFEWPGVITPGSISEISTVTSDYLPTILDMLDLSMPDARPLDGISLLPLLKGEMDARPGPIGFQMPSPRLRVLSGERFKLYSRGGRKRLYDLKADPSESRDVSAEHPQVVEAMAKELGVWARSCKASEAGADYE